MLATTVDEDEHPFPWKQVAPSIVFVLSVALMGVGARSTHWALLLAGGLIAVGSFVAAMLLELAANREDAEMSGDPAAVSALAMSSDLTAQIGRRLRR